MGYRLRDGDLEKIALIFLWPLPSLFYCYVESLTNLLIEAETMEFKTSMIGEVRRDNCGSQLDMKRPKFELNIDRELISIPCNGILFSIAGVGDD